MKDKLLLLNNAFHKSDQHQSMPELGWEISDDDVTKGEINKGLT